MAFNLSPSSLHSQANEIRELDLVLGADGSSAAELLQVAEKLFTISQMEPKCGRGWLRDWSLEEVGGVMTRLLQRLSDDNAADELKATCASAFANFCCGDDIAFAAGTMGAVEALLAKLDDREASDLLKRECAVALYNVCFHDDNSARVAVAAHAIDKIVAILRDESASDFLKSHCASVANVCVGYSEEETGCRHWSCQIPWLFDSHSSFLASTFYSGLLSGLDGCHDCLAEEDPHDTMRNSRNEERAADVRTTEQGSEEQRKEVQPEGEEYRMQEQPVLQSRTEQKEWMELWPAEQSEWKERHSSELPVLQDRAEQQELVKSWPAEQLRKWGQYQEEINSKQEELLRRGQLVERFSCTFFSCGASFNFREEIDEHTVEVHGGAPSLVNNAKVFLEATQATTAVHGGADFTESAAEPSNSLVFEEVAFNASDITATSVGSEEVATEIAESEDAVLILAEPEDAAKKHAGDPLAKQEGGTYEFWTLSEQTAFFTALSLHGRDWDRLQEVVPEKSVKRVKKFFYRHIRNVKNALDREFAPGEDVPALLHIWDLLKLHSPENVLANKPLTWVRLKPEQVQELMKENTGADGKISHPDWATSTSRIAPEKAASASASLLESLAGRPAVESAKLAAAIETTGDHSRKRIVAAGARSQVTEQHESSRIQSKAVTITTTGSNFQAPLQPSRQKREKVEPSLQSALNGSPLLESTLPTDLRGDALVGARVLVYWEAMNTSYEGTIASFARSRSARQGGEYTVKYDDGEVHMEIFESMKFLAFPPSTPEKSWRPRETKGDFLDRNTPKNISVAECDEMALEQKMHRSEKSLENSQLNSITVGGTETDPQLATESFYKNPAPRTTGDLLDEAILLFGCESNSYPAIAKYLGAGFTSDDVKAVLLERALQGSKNRSGLRESRWESFDPETLAGDDGQERCEKHSVCIGADCFFICACKDHYDIEDSSVPPHENSAEPEDAAMKTPGSESNASQIAFSTPKDQEQAELPPFASSEELGPKNGLTLARSDGCVDLMVEVNADRSKANENIEDVSEEPTFGSETDCAVRLDSFFTGNGKEIFVSRHAVSLGTAIMDLFALSKLGHKEVQTPGLPSLSPSPSIALSDRKRSRAKRSSGEVALSQRHLKRGKHAAETASRPATFTLEVSSREDKQDSLRSLLEELCEAQRINEALYCTLEAQVRATLSLQDERDLLRVESEKLKQHA